MIGGFAGQPPHTGYEPNPHDFEHRGFDTKMVTRYSLQTHIKLVLEQKFNHKCLLWGHRCKVTAWTLSPLQITGATPSGSQVPRIPRLMVSYPTQCGPPWEQARTKRDNINKKDLRALLNNTKQRRQRKLKLQLHAPTENLTITNTHEDKHLNPNADASVSQQQLSHNNRGNSSLGSSARNFDQRSDE